MSGLDREIKYLKGVGEKRSALFKKLGIVTVDDLIHYFPRSYEDFSNPTPIAQAVQGQVCCIRATVTSPVRETMIRGGMKLYKLRVSDESGTIGITYFNNRYIGSMLTEGEQYLFYGKIGGNLFSDMVSPEFSKLQQAGLLPVYPLTEGLTNRTLRDTAAQALRLFPDDLSDPLPAGLRLEYGLCHWRFALETIHFPPTPKELETARRRLAFEELFCLQLGLLTLRSRNKRETAAVCAQPGDFEALYATLPFEPTGAQRRAVAEAAADMARPVPMNRLLQGDVGSGKTAVAAALCWLAVKNGFQAAVMAPTEILAQQHYGTLSALLAQCGLKTGLLTGGMGAKEKRAVREEIAQGRLDVVTGTHALLQEGVDFKSLGLVVTDEQHRFGVAQRALLTEKGANPHVLVMSATPIPRTLALLIYGDLDVSQLDELPAGRRKVETYAVDSTKRDRIYRFIKKLIDGGLQCFIVCPMIDQDESDLSAAESYARKLREGQLAGYRIGLLHGRLRAAEKEKVMREFAAGGCDVLVSTTVIEVGVDVPNAVVMVVENAERFGLSQLHQLRGRVGRGSEKSYCILVSDAQNKEALGRLRIMCDTADGFKIAEKDLELRGPGDFFGHRQHGLPELRVADLFSDMQLLREAQQAARALLEKDPGLSGKENLGLRLLVNRLFSENEDVIFN
ncbi:MAG: ATP-dependent DNA helicase RecG [Clostridia bacterium]|nr:ATP-dependent DNA helicase RecG [Clostridia bacterium]